MRVGVWFDLPGAAINEGEGLLRLLSLIFMGFRELDCEVVFVAPRDARRPAQPWFDEFAANSGRCRFSFVTPRSGAFGDPGEREQRVAVARQIGADVWLAFRVDRNAAGEIPGPWVSTFADFILVEYPVHYQESVFAALMGPTEQGMRAVDRLVCFSEHVKRVHAVGAFGVDPARVALVPHAPFDYFQFCRQGFGAAPSEARLPKVDSLAALTRATAADYVRTFVQNTTSSYYDARGQRYLQPYLATFPYEEVDFVMMSSRNRPHKNFITAVKAVGELIRTKYAPIKAITTSPLDLHGTEPVAAYLQANKLHLDVLSINHLPSHIHACLYRLAAVTVHPSPFEGGFPFTFSESLSMGTPIILARGPAVEEFLTPGELEAFCFEPSSSADLARRIEKVLENRAEYLDRQLDLLERQKASRTWGDVAREYVAAFSAASSAYWRRGDLFQMRLTREDSGSADGALFIHSAKDDGRISGAQSLTERYLPAKFAGAFELTFVFAEGEPFDIETNLILVSGYWPDGFVHYGPEAVDLKTRLVGGEVHAVMTFKTPASHVGLTKEFRISWRGLAAARVRTVSWRAVWADDADED